MQLFGKVSLNSVRLVACTITIPLLLELFEFVVVVVDVFSFHLFYSSIFHLIYFAMTMWRTSRQANTPTHSHDNNKHKT